MVDADGATKFSDLDNVERELDKFEGGKDGMAVSVGSRAHLQQEAVAQVSCIFFNITARWFLGISKVHLDQWQPTWVLNLPADLSRGEQYLFMKEGIPMASEITQSVFEWNLQMLYPVLEYPVYEIYAT